MPNEMPSRAANSLCVNAIEIEIELNSIKKSKISAILYKSQLILVANLLKDISAAFSGCFHFRQNINEIKSFCNFPIHMNQFP